MVETYVSSLPGNSQEPDLAVGLLARGPVESGEWSLFRTGWLNRPLTSAR